MFETPQIRIHVPLSNLAESGPIRSIPNSPNISAVGGLVKVIMHAC